jgi:hypothetical protein
LSSRPCLPCGRRLYKQQGSFALRTLPPPQRYYDGVNIAARLEGIAKPGAICLSEDAYRQVKGRLGLAAMDLGPTRLKNIAEPIRVYSLEVGQPALSKPTKRGGVSKRLWRCWPRASWRSS